MAKERSLSWWVPSLTIALFFTVFYFVSQYNYAVYHSITELSLVMLAFTIFAVTWNSRRFNDNNYIRLIGISFLFFGGLNVFHTLAYPGMGIFQEEQPGQLLMQTAIAGRYFVSLSFFIAPFFLKRKLRIGLFFLVYTVAFFLLLGSIFYWNIFPSVVDQTGMTTFAKTILYLDSLPYLGAIGLLVRYRRKFDKSLVRLLITSIAAAIGSGIAAAMGSEMAFITNMNGAIFLYMTGHFLSFISFYLVYRAFVEIGLARPYSVLFNNLKQSEENLSQKAIELDRTNKELSLEIYGHKRAAEELIRSQEQLRNFSKHLDDAMEEERKAIAREIHDEFGQVMTALKWDLCLLSEDEPEANNRRIKCIQGMSSLIDSATASIQTVTERLRPTQLDNLGLGPAIEWQATEFQKRTNIKCKLNLDGINSVQGDCALAVFRILQETLTNVSRHSQATRVDIDFEKNDGRLLFTVLDNGKGITADQKSDVRSFGLMGMRERARLCGGQIEISGAEGEGTSVRLSIPAACKEDTSDKSACRG